MSDNRNDGLGSMVGVNTASIMNALSVSPRVNAVRDKVTVTLYSLETNTQPGYNQIFLNEMANVQRIRNGFVNAAIKAKRQAPEIVLSLLLVPDWDKKDNSYNNVDYTKNKLAFLVEAKRTFEKIEGVIVEDFFSKNSLTVDEKAYLHGLKAKGSNADIMKIRSIIDNFEERRHLQMDSNTVVPSFEELYNKTFNLHTIRWYTRHR